jgi:hypothetical protein
MAPRYEGEEVAALLPNTDLDGAKAVAENIRTAISRKAFRKRSIGKLAALLQASKFEIGSVLFYIGYRWHGVGRRHWTLIGAENATVEWDGESLVGWVTINGRPTKVRATRDMIHSHATGFNDAVTWEIVRYRAEIFEKLTPLLVKANR